MRLRPPHAPFAPFAPFALRAPRRSLAALAVLLVAACHAGGDGIGTAPAEGDPCPAKLPSVGAACDGPTSTSPRICCYLDGAAVGETGACGGGSDRETVAYCPGGTTGTWTVESPGDAAVVDSGADADASDASDASDAAPSDAADASDASDAAPSDAADASDAAASDAADAGVAVDASDADETG